MPPAMMVSKEAQNPIDSGRKANDDTVAAPYTEFAQSSGDPGSAVPKLAVGESYAAQFDDSLGIGCGDRPFFE